ncbi:MAG: MFS transporter [bacterium]
MTITAHQPCDAGVIRSARETNDCSRATGRWVLAAAVIGSSMAFIDGTAVNVALPVLQDDLGASVAELQWIVESYALLLAALMIVGGSLGDRFGRRRTFAAGTAIFAGASLWCALSPGVGQLIAARALQGLGGALLVPGSLALISANFSARRRGAAIGLWSGFTAITMAFGPVLGGWLVENVSWRWVFYINLPLAVVVLAIAYLRIPETHREHQGERLDWPGALLAGGGLGGVVFGLIESASLGLTHPLVLISLAGGVALLALFLLVESRSPSPMMPLALFRSRNFSGANLLTLLLYAALSGGLFFFPFNLIQVQGYSATASGAAFLPFVVLMSLLSRWSGGLVDRYGARPPLVAGPLLAAAGFVLFALPGIGGSYWVTFFPAIAVLGLGMSICVAPLTTVVMNAVDEGEAGVASGINNAVSRAAGLIAIAVMGVFALAVFNAGLDGQLEGLAVPPEIQAALDLERIKLAGATIPSGAGDVLAAALKRAIDESFVASFRWLMAVAAALSLSAALVAAVTIEGRKGPAAA